MLGPIVLLLTSILVSLVWSTGVEFSRGNKDFGCSNSNGTAFFWYEPTMSGPRDIFHQKNDFSPGAGRMPQPFGRFFVGKGFPRAMMLGLPVLILMFR